MTFKKTTPKVKKFLNFELTSAKLSTKDAAGGFIIEGFANTTTKDRVGDVVLASAFAKSLATYLTNPIILAGAHHDLSSLWRCGCVVVTHGCSFTVSRL